MKKILYLILISACNLYAQLDFTYKVPELPLPPSISDFKSFNNGSADFSDIDGDGDLDYIVTGQIGNTVNSGGTYLYINDGDGHFSEVAGTPFQPSFDSDLLFADLDSDGDEDILLSGMNGFTSTDFMEIYWNDGSGNFTEDTMNTFDGFSYSSLAAHDVDGDMDLDIMVGGAEFANYKETRLYLNDGSGIFTQDFNSTFTGIKEGSIDFADMDLDGDDDLILIGDANPNNICELYLNDGNGVFEHDTLVIMIGLDRADAVFKDLNGDNYPDLLISGRDDGGYKQTNLYQNDGAGNFIDLGTSGLTVTDVTKYFSDDIDNDGDPDIVLSGKTNFGYANEMFMNQGSMSFILNSNGIMEETAYNLAIAFDMTQDGLKEVITGGGQYYNHGSGVFERITGNIVPGIINGQSALGDVDNDGDLDIFITGQHDNSYISKLFINDGTNNYAEAGVQPFVNVSESAVEMGDIDGDNDLDIILSGKTTLSKYTRIYLNDGTGVYSYSQALTGMAQGDLKLFDCDADNDLDLLLCGGFSGTLLYLNDGAGNYTPSSNSFPYLNYGSCDAADIDLDGDMDIVIAGYNTQEKTIIYLNDGNGNYSELTNAVLPGIQLGVVEFADVDFDNDPDLLVSGDAVSGSITNLYLNDGTGNFTPSNNVFPSLTNSDAEFADVDGDLDMDLLLAGEIGVSNNHATNLYVNDGFGNFTSVSNMPFIKATTPYLQIDDLNNDGDPDVFLVGGFTARMYENTSCFDHTFIYDTICSGDAYTFADGTILSSISNDTIHYSTVPNISGCDSTTVTFLEVQPADYYETFQFCDSVDYSFPDGNIINNITLDTTYSSNLVSSIGCDSIVHTTIDIINSYDSIAYVTQCVGQPYTFPDGSTITSLTGDTIQTSTMTALNGCDSIITTNLIVSPNYQLYDTVQVCEGQLYSFPDSTVITVYADTTQQSDLFTLDGCDSTIYTTIQLIPVDTVFNTLPTCYSDTVIFSDGQVWNGVDSDSVHYSLLTAVSGCDSIVVDSVNMNGGAFSEFINVCQNDNYTVPDGTNLINLQVDTTYVSNLTTTNFCDSIITTYITVHQVVFYDTVVACNGVNYTYPDGSVQSNVIADTTQVSSLIGAMGCDSLIYTTLNVLPSIDTSIVKTNNELQASYTGASQYDWFSCDSTNFNPIAPSQDSFIAPTTGYYGVIIYDGNCSDTSYCYSITNQDFYNNPNYDSLYAEVYPYAVTTAGTCDANAFGWAVGGVSPYQFDWFTQTNNVNSQFIDSLCDGLHTLKVLDAIGDSVLVDYYITDTANYNYQSTPPSPVVDTIFISDFNCNINYNLPLDTAYISNINYLYPGSGNNEVFQIEITYVQLGVPYTSIDTIEISLNGTYIIYFNVYCVTKAAIQVKTEVMSFQYPELLTIKGAQEKDNFVIYPNPSSDLINISFIDESLDKFITIFDTQGRKVYEANIGSDQFVQVPISNWSDGTYLIRFISDNYTVTESFVKY